MKYYGRDRFSKIRFVCFIWLVLLGLVIGYIKPYYAPFLITIESFLILAYRERLLKGNPEGTASHSWKAIRQHGRQIRIYLLLRMATSS